MAAKPKAEPAYTSLSIRKTGPTTYVVITHSHAEDGAVLSRDISADQPYHLAVHSLKRQAADLFAHLATV